MKWTSTRASLLLVVLSALSAHAQEPEATVETQSFTVKGSLQTPGSRQDKLPFGSFNATRFGPNEHSRAYSAFQLGHYLTALKIAKPLAEKGDPSAQTLLGEIYSGGHGVRPDPDEAARWYKRAAEAGVPAAQFQYALMVLDGVHAKKDDVFAERLMKQAAEGGNAMAQFNYAQMLMAQGGPENRETALRFYQRAARSNIADAQYALAEFAARGSILEKPDLQAARRWLTASAKNGFSSAIVELALYKMNGQGGPQDLEGGFRLLKEAAQRENPAAMSQLAKAYRAGLGTEPDPIAAASWYFAARRAGVRDRTMETFLNGLSAEQHREALAQANRL